MIGLLTSLVNDMICFVRTGATLVVNDIISGLAFLVSTVIGLMPDIPAAPSLPDSMQTALAWIAWFFPVGTLVDVMAFMLAAWVIWLGVSTALRWAKAL